MLDLEKFRALLRSYEGDEEATAFLLSCARAFMEYAHAIYNRELALWAGTDGARSAAGDDERAG